jgi:hypothetical protein
MPKNYTKVVNGTSYAEHTPDAVIRVLEQAREARTRIRVRLGFTEQHEDVLSGKAVLGRDWLDEFECEGTVGRSMGPQRVPLLINNARSMGGGVVSTDCIVRIIDTKTKRVLYSHPKYHTGNFKIVPVDELVAATVSFRHGGPLLTHAVTRDGEEQARFETKEKAERWVRKMSL